MKLPKILLAVFTAAALLCACGTQDLPAPTPTPTGTVPTEAVDPVKVYDQAAAHLRTLADLQIRYTYQEARTVGGEIYRKSRTGTADYLGLGTADPSALVSEEITYGGYSTSYIESYLSGSAYARVNNYSFRCPITAEEFLARQIPALLLDPGCYESITLTPTDTGSLLSFRNAHAPESWLALDGSAEISSAAGDAVLDSSGHFTAFTYQISYTLDSAVYVLEFTVDLTPGCEDFTDRQPVYGDDCPVISDLWIPRYLLSAVGDIYTAQSMSVSYSDSLYFSYYDSHRTQSSVFYTHGSGEEFLAAMSTQVSTTDFAGVSSGNAWHVTYRDGVCTEQMGDGAPTVNDSATAETIRTGWEDSILSSLIPLEYIASAQLTDEGDFLYIHFEANDSFVTNISNSIYQLFQVSLDSWADSQRTAAASGYLTINKYTGLPTAMGMFLDRTHTITGVEFPLVYQLDQSVTLSCPDAYKAITGQDPSESPAGSAAPLLYKVTDSEGRYLWLLGTMPFGDSRTAALPQTLLDALAQSDALAVEFDAEAFAAAIESDPALQAQVAALYYNTAKPLSDILPDDLYDRIQPLLYATGSRSDSSEYLNLSVWQNLIEELYLHQSYGLTASRRCEQRLLQLAAQNELPVYEISSGLAHLQALTGLSQSLQIQLLEQLVSGGMGDYCDANIRYYELWCAGDEESLITALSKNANGMKEALGKQYEEYRKAMFTDRNARILQALESYLKSGETVFCAVEISNLLGSDGLADRLKDAGYTVEVVPYE